MNRVTEAIKRMRKQIADQIASGKTTQEKVNALHKTLDMPWNEYSMFQTHKSAAVGVKLTLEEANTIYAVLGESGPEQFNKSDIATKTVLTQIFLWANVSR